MPRIRTIKPEFWSDEKLGPMRAVDRLTFLGLISMADDMGRLLDNLKQIDAFVFPYTSDSCKASLASLESSGRIVRGVTEQGQSVIQIRNWHHQKIEKPNLAGALPPIAGVQDETTEYRARKRVPAYMKDEVWSRDGGSCQSCGRTGLRKTKRDRYDSGNDLGEVDHIHEAADGGEVAPENLQLLCLPCNRKKAGKMRRTRNADRSANDTARISDKSQNNRGVESDASTTRSTTFDRIPDTNDRRPESVTAPSRADFVRALLPLPAVDVFDGLLRASRNPAGVVAVIESLAAPMTGGHPPYSWEVIGSAVIDYAGKSPAEFSAKLLRAICADFAKLPALPPMGEFPSVSSVVPFQPRAGSKQARNMAALAEGLRIVQAQEREAAANG